MNDEQALAYIEEELAKKKIATSKGKARALKTLTNNSDQNVARLARHVLKYTEQEDAEERFAKFLAQKATSMNKKLHQLVPAEIQLARKAFDENE